MHHYQIVLGQMRAGLSDRQIAKLKLMGRAKCMQFRAVAQAQEWFAGALPDAATLAGIFSNAAVAPKSVRSGVEAFRERVCAWVDDDVSAASIFSALKREGFGGSYSAVRRFVSKLPKVIRATVPLDFAPAESAQVDFGSGLSL